MVLTLPWSGNSTNRQVWYQQPEQLIFYVTNLSWLVSVKFTRDVWSMLYSRYRVSETLVYDGDLWYHIWCHPCVWWQFVALFEVTLVYDGDLWFYLMSTLCKMAICDTIFVVPLVYNGDLWEHIWCHSCVRWWFVVPYLMSPLCMMVICGIIFDVTLVFDGDLWNHIWCHPYVWWWFVGSYLMSPLCMMAICARTALHCIAGFGWSVLHNMANVNCTVKYVLCFDIWDGATSIIKLQKLNQPGHFFQKNIFFISEEQKDLILKLTNTLYGINNGLNFHFLGVIIHFKEYILLARHAKLSIEQTRLSHGEGLPPDPYS